MKTLAILLLLSSPAAADITQRHQRPGRITCAVVRDFVAVVGREEAERMARSSGASEARIEAARRCLPRLSNRRDITPAYDRSLQPDGR